MNKNNPWLEISSSDYENHMTEVGQAQILNDLTKRSLLKYQPVNFALLGCATGNGFEHINPEITKNIHAIDLNPNYLKIVRERFEHKMGLKMYNIDIQKDNLPIKNIDLFLIGLVLEYVVEPKKVIEKVFKTLNDSGILIIVIQKNNNTTFVTKTKYKSLEKLSEISNEIEVKKVNELILQQKMDIVDRKAIDVNKNKSFISLTYKVRK